MYGMEDGNLLPNNDLRSRLSELGLAWVDLNWKKRGSILFGGERSFYGLGAGVFVKMSRNGQGFVVRLPSSTRPVVDQMVLPDQDVIVEGFAMDPSQDLLAILLNGPAFVILLIFSLV